MDILYSAYLLGHEILKKMLRIIANGLKYPENPKFYVIRINESEVSEYVKNENLNKKENKFVLDCTNLEKSKLKYYVPLFDYNLGEFFGNKAIKKQYRNSISKSHAFICLSYFIVVRTIPYFIILIFCKRNIMWFSINF